MVSLNKNRASRQRTSELAARRRSSFRTSSLELLESRIVLAYSIRATELSNLGAVIASSTQSSPLGPGNSFTAVFSLPDISIVLVGNTSNTGPGFTAHSTSINIDYNGPTGANSDQAHRGAGRQLHEPGRRPGADQQQRLAQHVGP